MLIPAYQEWLVRLEATYEAVRYCCVHRVGDRALAEQVGARVVAGLIAKPGVFRYWGLPYSGRIAHLAEPLIAQASRGTLPAGADWYGLLTALRAVPADQQEIFVLTCVEGHDDPRLAAALGCDEDEARLRRAQLTDHWNEILARSGPSREVR